jgi:hypothetical protein
MAIKKQSKPVRCAACARLTKVTVVYKGDVVCVPCKVALAEG